MRAQLRALLALCAALQALAGTGITVTNNYKKEVNVKIQGTGVGGCDIVIQPGEVNQSDCWCLWGTINYSFCSYLPGKIKQVEGDHNSTTPVQQGKCPVVTGESLMCSDLASLGNCYDGHYSCEITSSGLCTCKSD